MSSIVSFRWRPRSEWLRTATKAESRDRCTEHSNLSITLNTCIIALTQWAYSSVGRVSASHADSPGFDSLCVQTFLLFGPVLFCCLVIITHRSLVAGCSLVAMTAHRGRSDMYVCRQWCCRRHHLPPPPFAATVTPVMARLPAS